MENLEWSRIKAQIEPFAKTARGRQLIHDLDVFKSAAEAEASMAEIIAGKSWIEQFPTPEFGAFFNIENSLKDIKMNRLLTINDQLTILHFLKAIDRVQIRFKNILPALNIDPLTPYHEGLDSLKKVRDVLKISYEPDRVLDSASLALSQIRKDLKNVEKKLNDSLKSIVQKYKKDLTEGFFTQRQGRYVLPVKISAKNRFKGSLVDYSASGETVYMEPSEVGELSAEKRRLEAIEATEIERILTMTSFLLHEHYDVLRHNHTQVTELDAIFAKADYATVYDAHPPTFKASLHLIDARHPLIEKDHVVANTITLEPPQIAMIISGSNTGGKTVVLKTVGICAMMAKAGLLVPAAAGSSLPFYHHIFADIGDEQSIEQSLSTFSSHLTQIVEMVEKATAHDLVILDEVGSGTDPQAGAALARAMIDHFRAIKAHLFVTTHYPDLKAYAYDHDDVINASVAFDKESLQPTYHLFLDTPGESHAFLIAERLGLKHNIIEQAKRYLNDAASPVSQLIQTLETEKVQLEKAKLLLEKERDDLAKNQANLNAQQATLAAEKRTYKDQLKQSSQKAIDALKQKMEEALDQLKTASSLKPHEIQSVKAIFHQEGESSPKKTDEPIMIGDRVDVKKFNRPGQVKDIKNHRYIVQMGNLEMTLKKEEIEFLRHDVITQKPQDKVDVGPSKRVASELDLRGLNVEEAQEKLFKYIDDCSLSKMPYARIIHGYGTLALRKMVKESVQTSPLIQSHRDGQGSEGGQGVTVIYFE